VELLYPLPARTLVAPHLVFNSSQSGKAWEGTRVARFASAE